MKRLNYMYKTELSKKEKIISCYGHMKEASVARMFNVFPSYVNKVWKDAGCKELDEWVETQKCT